jgi:metal-sulfur cluster biosynthetic enzyme
MKETQYSHRTDTVARKVELLGQALRNGRHELARSLAASIKDTVTFRQQVEQHPETPVVTSDAGHVVDDLPEPWRRWAAGWRYFESFALDETVGLARGGEPVEIPISLPADHAAPVFRDVRLARVEIGSGMLREVPRQFEREMRRGDRRHGRLLFQADSNAHSRTVYLLLYGNPDAELPSYPSDLRVTGEGYGLDIENSYYRASLSRQMGQLESLQYKRGGGLNLVAQGDGHGEPPGIDWAHDYVTSGAYQKMRVTNWANCPDYEVIRGPLCLVLRRWGFPHSTVHPLFTPGRMHITVEYRFFAGVPYFTKRGTMEAIQELEITYLRDDEWVFSDGPFTDLIWMASDGKLRSGEVDDAHKDDLWSIGFFNAQTRDAFVALFLEHEAENFDGLKHSGAPTLNYSYGGQLWSRWAARGNPTLQAGAKLKQHNAYLTIPFPENGGARIVEEFRHRLMNPLAPSACDLPHIKAASEGRLARRGENADNPVSKQAIWKALREVRDTQLYKVDANVVNMGYVYDVRVRGDVVHIVMTMPHRGRPKFGFVGNPIRARLLQVPGVRDVRIENVWDPPWDANRLSESARTMFGF